jgi:hypothetical protein
VAHGPAVGRDQAQEEAGLGPHLSAEEIGHHRGERRVVGEPVLGLAAVSSGAQLLDVGLAGTQPIQRFARAGRLKAGVELGGEVAEQARG